MGFKKQCCIKLGKKDFPSPTMEMLYDILVASSQEYCNQGRRGGGQTYFGPIWMLSPWHSCLIPAINSTFYYLKNKLTIFLIIICLVSRCGTVSCIRVACVTAKSVYQGSRIQGTLKKTSDIDWLSPNLLLDLVQFFSSTYLHILKHRLYRAFLHMYLYSSATWFCKRS